MAAIGFDETEKYTQMSLCYLEIIIEAPSLDHSMQI